MIDFFKWGRDFLERSQLQSLRNISFLPEEPAQKVLMRMEGLSGVEIHFLEQYRRFCNDRLRARDVYNIWYWMLTPVESEVDEYAYCYTPDYNLTTLGQRMKDATYREQAKL